MENSRSHNPQLTTDLASQHKKEYRSYAQFIPSSHFTCPLPFPKKKKAQLKEIRNFHYVTKPPKPQSPSELVNQLDNSFPLTTPPEGTGGRIGASSLGGPVLCVATCCCCCGSGAGLVLVGGLMKPSYVGPC